MRCNKCQIENHNGAQFCMNCGATLSANAFGGTTVVAHAPMAPVAMTPQQQKTVRQNAQACGSAPIALRPTQVLSGRANQLEHTFLVNDVSGSMSGTFCGCASKEEAVIRATVSMVVEKERLDARDEIGVVVFNSCAKVLLSMSPLHSYKRQIITTLQSMSPDNGTDINEGLKAARDAFDWNRTDVVRRIVLLTDGQGGSPLQTADDLKSRGVVIDAIGVGEKSDVDEKLLREIASTVGGELRYVFLHDQPALQEHYTNLANKTAVI